MIGTTYAVASLYGAATRADQGACPRSVQELTSRLPNKVRPCVVPPHDRDLIETAQALGLTEQAKFHALRVRWDDAARQGFQRLNSYQAVHMMAPDARVIVDYGRKDVWHQFAFPAGRAQPGQPGSMHPWRLSAKGPQGKRDFLLGGLLHLVTPIPPGVLIRLGELNEAKLFDSTLVLAPTDYFADPLPTPPPVRVPYVSRDPVLLGYIGNVGFFIAAWV